MQNAARRSRPIPCLLATAALAAACSSGPTAKPSKPARAGHVAAAAAADQRETKALGRFLEERVEHELTTLNSEGEPWPTGYTTYASIVKLQEGPRGARGKVTCTVALTLLDAGSSPVAVIRGNAIAEGAADDASLSREAVGGAAHSAVFQLPSVLRKVNAQ
jgi:hypothetical protein